VSVVHRLQVAYFVTKGAAEDVVASTAVWRVVKTLRTSVGSVVEAACMAVDPKKVVSFSVTLVLCLRRIWSGYPLSREFSRLAPPAKAEWCD
jgi:hypothetical protein